MELMKNFRNSLFLGLFLLICGGVLTGTVAVAAYELKSPRVNIKFLSLDGKPVPGVIAVLEAHEYVEGENRYTRRREWLDTVFRTVKLVSNSRGEMTLPRVRLS